jgi:death-on-curing protein
MSRLVPQHEPEWIEADTVQIIHERQIAEHGGGTGVRDLGLLDSPLNRARQLWCYSNPPPDVCAMAAAYAFGLANNHPFIDGKKRTAAVVCELFLEVNGLRFTIGEVEKYPHYMALASGIHTEESFAQWLREHTNPLAQ